MPPKHRDKYAADQIEDSKTEAIRLQSDHEAFLQAFEKPTQIYRYLQARNIISPIFMHRTLTYMKGRCKRTNIGRRKFKVDSMLEKVTAKYKEKVNQSLNTEYLNIAFTNFCCKDELDTCGDIDAEVYLVRKCHKRRKNVLDPTSRVSIGKISMPATSTSPSKHDATLSISSVYFGANSGYQSANYYLLIRVVRYIKPKSQSRSDGDVAEEYNETGLCNGSVTDLEDEPVPKKRRSSRLSPPESSPSTTPPHLDSRQNRTNVMSSDSKITKTATQTCSETNGIKGTEFKSYSVELAVYDRQHKCQLTDGKYELLLTPENADSIDTTGGDTTADMADAVWLASPGDSPGGPFKAFRSSAYLKFKLSWSKTAARGAVESPIPDEQFLENNRIHCAVEDTVDIAQRAEARAEARRQELAQQSPSKRRVYYQFLYQNNAKQQTEAREDLRCPWCATWCHRLYSLLKHLRLCHPRFLFTYSVHARGARIDVAISEHYDGSYAGNSQDIHSHLGFAYCRKGPTRRTSVTWVLVFRPKKPKFSLSEFCELENDSTASRQLVQGHNRLYYHTVTSQPVRPCEIDIDPESENDPEWLRQKTINMIDEFTDVNEGEKEVMKMWNIHIMHQHYIGDCQLPVACLTFVDEYGPRIIVENLTKNFVLHMVNLYDFGLIRLDVIQQTMSRFVQLQNHMAEIRGHEGGKVLSAAETATAALKLMPGIQSHQSLCAGFKWDGNQSSGLSSAELSQADTTDDDSQMSQGEHTPHATASCQPAVS